MVARKKTATGVAGATRVAVAVVEQPIEGEVLPHMELGRALSQISTPLDLQALRAEYQALPSDLGAAAQTIEGNKQLKAFVKECSGIRNKLTAAHKDAKAPWWAACKALDGKLKELTAVVQELEAPAKRALDEEAGREAKLLAEANAAKLRELEAENQRLRELATQHDVPTASLEEKEVVLTIRGRDSARLARELFTDEVYVDLKQGEDGTPYVLELVLRRKEIQE